MPHSGIPKGHVTLIEAARRLKLTYQQAHNRALSGSLPASRIGDRWYVAERAIDEPKSIDLPKPTHIHERVAKKQRKGTS